MIRLDLAELPGSARLARGAHKFTQCGDIGAVSPDPCGIDGQSKAFGGFHIDARVIEFREAKPNGRKNALNTAWVHGSRRPATLPGPVCDREELVPIVLVPHRLLPRLRDLGRYRHEMRQLPLWSLSGIYLNISRSWN